MNEINKVNMDRKAGIKLMYIRGFIGPMGGGKDYQANKLIEEEGYVKVAFADSLRDMAWKILSWKPANEEEYDRFKKGDIFLDSMAGFINGRLFLQNLGETLRETDKNFWVKELKKRLDILEINGYNKIVVTDIRHDNELEFIKSLSYKSDNKIIFCNYKSDRYRVDDSHISEALAHKYLENGYKDGDEIIL